MTRAPWIVALLALAPAPASAQSLGQQLDRPSPDRSAWQPAPVRTPEPVRIEAPEEPEEPPQPGASRPPWGALSAIPFTLTGVSLGLFIGAQVRLNDIANDPAWLAARSRFPMAENICEVDPDPRTQDFCSEADALEVLSVTSAIVGAAGLVTGVVLLVLELSDDTSASASARAGGGAVSLSHRF